MSTPSNKSPATPTPSKAPSPAPKADKPLASSTSKSSASAKPSTGLAATPTKGPTLTSAQLEARRSARAKARYWKKLEMTWTIVPIILVFTVAALSTPLLYSLTTGPSAYGATPNVYIDVWGHQWFWQFNYTDPIYANNSTEAKALTNGTGVTESLGTLYVPVNGIVQVNVSSVDVIHDFNVPGLGVRIDAIPGRINHYWFTIPAGTIPGQRFYIQCTEFCGQGHYAMTGWIQTVKCNTLIGSCPA